MTLRKNATRKVFTEKYIIKRATDICRKTMTHLT